MSERLSDDDRAESHERLEDDDELLYRQVASREFIDEDRLSSQAFVPHSKSTKLSVHRSRVVVTAQEAYEIYLDGEGEHSEGTWAVSVVEVKLSGLHGAFDDTAQDPPKPRGHAYVSFANNPADSNTGRAKWRQRRGGDLAQHAFARGPLYEPPAPCVTTQAPLGI